jgi:hypothetical protein
MLSCRSARGLAARAKAPVARSAEVRRLWSLTFGLWVTRLTYT